MISTWNPEALRFLQRKPGRTWQGTWHRLRVWLTDPQGHPVRSSIFIWACQEDAASGAGILPPGQERDVGFALQVLQELATDRKSGGYLPGRLEVAEPSLAEGLRREVEGLGIGVRLVGDLPDLEETLRSMDAENAGPYDLDSYLVGEAVDLPRVRRFAEAAAAFHQAGLWNHLSDEDLIHVESEAPEKELGWFTIMGASDHEYGLAFFPSRRRYESVQGEEDMETAFRGGLWSVTFDGADHVPFADTELWEEHALPLAGAEAYPFAARMSTRLIVRPDATQLNFLEGLLRTLASTTEDEIDAGRWEKTVETHDGPRAYRLAIPDLLEPIQPGRDRGSAAGPLLDRRAMERTMADLRKILAEHEFESLEEMNKFMRNEFIGKPVPHRVGSDPLEQAQDLVYQAFDSHGRRRVQLARKALEICPDCADAWSILGEATPDPERALEYFRKGVAAGRRTIGEERLADPEGFWSDLETRPFMRAIEKEATALADLNRPAEAIQGFQELLRLNSGDNQGARYPLLRLYLESERNDEARNLMDQYEGEILGFWTYARALLLFRCEGDSPGSQAALAQAFRQHPRVPKFLLGLREPPPSSPLGIQMGGSEEDSWSAQLLCDAWRRTEGAEQWLETALRAKRRANREKRDGRAGPGRGKGRAGKPRPKGR